MSRLNEGYGPIKQKPKQHWEVGAYEPKVTKTIEIPIPLKDNGMVTIGNLPTNLNQKEAERICRVIMALSTDE